MTDEVAPDGSPLAVYLAAPPGDTAAVAAEVQPPPARVLELGCGVGRETRTLLAWGYDVTAVDSSRMMLDHVTGARTVEADLFALDLGERFDLVVVGSHFIDDADVQQRSALLATCARHLAPAGAVLLERYDPTWVADPTSYGGTVGPVDVRFEVIDRGDAGLVAARLHYGLGERTWTQSFSFVPATCDLVGREAAVHGLVVAGVHGEDDTWLQLRSAAS